jgi:hypothetical protein
MSPTTPSIRGTIPESYTGAIFYRMETFSYEGMRRTVYHGVVTVLDRKRMQELGDPRNMTCSLYKLGILTDARGVLREKWREPLRARIPKSAPKSWPEFGVGGTLTVISSRIRDLIEALEPGANFFIPIDAETAGGSILRLYALFIGIVPARTALSMKANRTEFTASDYDGSPVFQRPEWLMGPSEHFGYLDPQVVGDHALLKDTASLWIFSAELVNQLGDVLPKGVAFVPMGVAGE